jgi:SH3-like domain-containing protein
MDHRQIAATYSIRVALLCALWTCACAERAAAETSPYQARVIVAGAPVNSGPGDNFYPTDTLTEGDTVEVYREKPGGWLAIRPPNGSYSWIAERDLIIKDGGLAEVVKDDVASRIGSRLNDRHNAAQVRLKKGEGVEVLGEENINGEKWFKIAPPAGEFRWIQASVVERIGPVEKSGSSPAALESTPAATALSEIQQTSATAATTTPAAAATSNSGAPPLLPMAKAADPSASAAPDSPSAVGTPASAAPSASAAASEPPATQASGELSHELAAVELRLSRMAAAPTNLWNTERLERDAAQLMGRAKTQAERDAVRVTQDKINRFAEIGRRANPTSVNLGGAGSGDPRTAIATTAAGGPYDAVGILRPVVSRRPGAPQFALVDERGQVISFVTATPDLNLQPYLGRRVGVVGNRGYIPEFQRSNVTAARVTPLVR